MCTGVIDISPTITSWARPIPDTARRARGDAHNTRRDTTAPAVARRADLVTVVRASSSSGFGRSRVPTTIAASP